MSAARTLDEWLSHQAAMHPVAIDLGLSRIRPVAQRLGLLTPSALTLTVAGTNGKGSSTAMLSSIYTAAGYRTGWYSSPHVLTYNERVRINGVPVSDALLVAAFEAIEAVRAGVSLTYFEWGTLAALWVFAQQDCQVQVLEVGLGGRLDAVNLVDADAVLITPIDLDHQVWLGNDRESIAREKAGVFRAGQLAVCSDPVPPASLQASAQGLGISLSCLGRDFHPEPAADNAWYWVAEGVRLLLPQPALRGRFQLNNAAGVVALVRLLDQRLAVTLAAMQQGLQQVALSGRMQSCQCQGVPWLLDVAHNAQSVQALADELAAQGGQVIAVFSALADKDIADMLRRLSPWVSCWHLSVLDTERAASREQLIQAMHQAGVPSGSVYWHDQLADACLAAQQMASDQVRLACGSFVTVEGVLRWLGARGCCS